MRVPPQVDEALEGLGSPGVSGNDLLIAAMLLGAEQMARSRWLAARADGRLRRSGLFGGRGRSLDSDEALAELFPGRLDPDL